MFVLHPQLAQDCFVIGQLNLCQILLMNDSNYPWFILVPERASISEIYQLNPDDQLQLWRESTDFTRLLAKHFHADKMNVAALGNVVPQLHVHHIVRYRHDPAWPAPVWGKLTAVPYSETDLQQRMADLMPVLGNNLHLA